MSAVTNSRVISAAEVRHLNAWDKYQAAMTGLGYLALATNGATLDAQAYQNAVVARAEWLEALSDTRGLRELLGSAS